MFHRAVHGPDGNSAGMLDAHFAHIARRYNCVLPGERLRRDRLNICLSFDDGYFDFHHSVLPLLIKHNLRALLAVSPALCPETCREDATRRLSLPEGEDYPHRSAAGFCTWQELRQIVSSGHVQIAAHGLTHADLHDEDANLQEEIIRSKQLLQARLGTPIKSFVFPFGRYSPRALDLVQLHYEYAFRIGHASNTDWDQPVLYRVAADRMRTPTAVFSRARRCRYLARQAWNRVRLR